MSDDMATRLLNGARMLGHLFRTSNGPKCGWDFGSCPHRPVPPFCEAKHQWIALARSAGREMHYDLPLVASFLVSETEASGLTIAVEVPSGTPAAKAIRDEIFEGDPMLPPEASPSVGPTVVKVGPRGAITLRGFMKLTSEAGAGSLKVFRVLEKFPGARVVGMEIKEEPAKEKVTP